MPDITNALIWTMIALCTCQCTKQGGQSNDPVTPVNGGVEIAAVSPLTGGFKTLVTITGKNFPLDTGKIMVLFNGKKAAITGLSNNKLNAYVPLQAGTGSLTININGTVLYNQLFNYTPGYVVTTFAGVASIRGGFADGIGAGARFNGPYRLAIDSADNLYVTDVGNYRIRKITPAGQVSTLCGNGVEGNTDGTATTATLSLAGGIALYDNKYVLFTSYNCLRKADMNGNVTTVAGNANIAGLTDGAGSQARIYGATAITSDRSLSGDFYFLQFGNTNFHSALRKFNINTGLVSTMNSKTIDLNGSSLDITFNKSDRCIYYVNPWDFKIYRADVSGTIYLYTGGSSVSGAYADGSLSEAKFAYLSGIYNDAAGDFYISDQGNHLIRKLSKGVVSTFAGVYGQHQVIEDAPVSAANFFVPNAIVRDRNGDFFVVDTEMNVIRKISLL